MFILPRHKALCFRGSWYGPSKIMYVKTHSIAKVAQDNIPRWFIMLHEPASRGSILPSPGEEQEQEVQRERSDKAEFSASLLWLMISQKADHSLR